MLDIDALMTENAALKQRVAAYEKILGQDLQAPPQFYLNEIEAKIYNALMNSKFVPAETIVNLYLPKTTSKKPLIMVRALVTYLRRKIAPFGVTVYHMRYHGYFMTEGHKAICREQMEISQQKFQMTNSSIANPN